MHEILEKIKANDSTLISCNLGARLESDQAHQLVEALKTNTYLTDLDISNNLDRINEKDIITLAFNKTLTSLNLSNTYLSNGAASILAKYTRVTFLDLSVHSISEELIAILASNKNLKTLVLLYSHIGNRGALKFANNETLTELDLGCNDINDDGAIGLAKNKSLVSLKLNDNNIGNKGAKAFAKNKSLRSLNLNSCYIGGKGACDLAKNKTLTSLTLANNEIGDRGFRAFADNSNITDLNLARNQISDEGVASFSNNKKLSSLNLNQNKIGNKGAIELAKNNTLSSLTLEANRIGNKGAIALAQNKNITSLDITGNNPIRDETAKKFVNNKSLIFLNLHCNEEIKKSITQTIERNKVRFQRKQTTLSIIAFLQVCRNPSMAFLPKELIHDISYLLFQNTLDDPDEALFISNIINVLITFMLDNPEKKRLSQITIDGKSFFKFWNKPQLTQPARVPNSISTIPTPVISLENVQNKTYKSTDFLLKKYHPVFTVLTMELAFSTLYKKITPNIRLWKFSAGVLLSSYLLFRIFNKELPEKNAQKREKDDNNKPEPKSEFQAKFWKDDSHSTIENLSSELLMYILLLLDDPFYISRLARTSKKLQQKLSNTSQLIYWFTLYQRDFVRNPKLLSPEKLRDYKTLYIKLSKEWRANKNLSKTHRELFRCIRVGDLSSIKKQTYDLSSRNDFMDVFFQEDNAISLASRYKRDDILAYFYQTMCDHIFCKSKQDNEGRTKLHWAAACNRLSEVNRLISAGKAVNKAQHGGATPLYMAAQNGHLEVVKTLLDAGADIDKDGFGGVTPFYIAAQNGHLEVVKTLLNAGAEVDKARLGGNTPLYIAAKNGHLEVVETLLDAGADVNKPGYGDTPLYIAASNGHLEMVKTLLAAKVDVNKPGYGDYGATPLYIAVQNGHLEVVKTLLAAEADVNKPHYSATPLYIAASNGHLEIVKTLLAAGADVNKYHGATPLHVAASNGHLEVVKTLLAAGTDVSKPCIDGSTPLYIAAQKERLEIVKTLLAAGADINKPCDGVSPLYIAAKMEHQKIYSFLKLWETKNLCKEKSLLKQVILLLEISIQLKSFFGSFKALFFSKKDNLNIVINKLKNYELNLNKEDLKSILAENRNDIPSEKYEFILNYVLADNPPGNTVSQIDKTNYGPSSSVVLNNFES